MSVNVQAGSVNQTVVIRILDTSGIPVTGAVASELDLKYRRTLSATVDLSESDLAALTTAFTAGGLKHINSGYYRVDVPDAAFAIGADQVWVGGTRTSSVIVGVIVNLRELGRSHAGVLVGGDAVTQQSITLAATANALYDNFYRGHRGRLVHAGISATPTLAIDAVAEKWKTTATVAGRYAGLTYSKAAATAQVFTAAHVITASKNGVILLQWDPVAATFSTKVVASPQAYDTMAQARAAEPACDTGKIKLGTIEIANNAGDWTANTDDLTNGSDVTTATFVNAPLIGGLEEGVLITAYTASTQIAALDRALLIAPHEGDELYLFTGSYGSTLTDVAAAVGALSVEAITLIKALQRIMAAAAGPRVKVGNNFKFQSPDGGKNRIEMDTDGAGNTVGSPTYDDT